MSLHISWVTQLDIDQFNFIFDVLNVFCLKHLVLENKVFTCLLKDLLYKAIKVIVVEFSAQNILVDFLAKLHHFLEVLVGNVILCWISLSHHEHLVVLLPETLEVRILQYDQIDNVKCGQDLSKVVKNLMIDDLPKGVLINLVFLVE